MVITPMMTTWAVIGLVVFLFITLYTRVRNPVEINRQREGAVYRDMYSGEYEVFFDVGTYYPGEEWAVEEDNIPLTRQDLLIDHEPVTVRNGNIVRISGGGNWLLGRRQFPDRYPDGTPHPHAGQLNLRGREVDELEAFDEAEILQAVTNFKAEQRVPEVMRRMRVALEELMSGFTVRDLTDVGRVLDEDDPTAEPLVLRVSLPTHVELSPDGDLELVWRDQANEIPINSRAALYETLGRGLEYILNFRLRDLGLSVINMRIHSVEPDASIQGAIEDRARNIHRREAAEALMQARPGEAAPDITFREALTPPDQYSAVAQAQSQRDVADRYARAFEQIGETASNAVIRGTENLTRFGRGG